MKKAAIFIIAAMLNISICRVMAGEYENELGISLDVSWVSKYIWHGQDLYDDHPAFQPSITFDLYGTGFTANLFASHATTSAGCTG